MERNTSFSLMDALRQALIAGEDGGEPTPFDFDEFVARQRAENSPRVMAG